MFCFIFFLEKKREGAARASISLDLVGFALFVLFSDQNKGAPGRRRGLLLGAGGWGLSLVRPWGAPGC